MLTLQAFTQSEDNRLQTCPLNQLKIENVYTTNVRLSQIPRLRFGVAQNHTYAPNVRRFCVGCAIIYQLASSCALKSFRRQLF